MAAASRGILPIDVLQPKSRRNSSVAPIVRRALHRRGEYIFLPPFSHPLAICNFLYY